MTVSNRPVCGACKRGLLVRQYSADDLYKQIAYYKYMFDMSKHEDARKYLENSRK